MIKYHLNNANCWEIYKLQSQVLGKKFSAFNLHIVSNEFKCLKKSRVATALQMKIQP